MLDFRVATFLCVCQTMNFTRAAQALSLTQPAVTQHIHVLEKYYGVPLFHYEKRTLTLTREGALLRDRLTSMVQDEQRIRTELAASPEDHPLLRFGVTRTIGEYAALSPLCHYLSDHPDCNLLLHYGNTEELLSLLDAGELSLALIEGNFPRGKYGTKKYRTEDFCAVCSAHHRFVCGTPREVRDLLPERLLIREPGSGTRNILERSLSALGLAIPDFPSYLQVENMHTLIRFLEKDMGISFLYRIAAREGLENGTLREITLSDSRLRHDFSFVWDDHSIYADRNHALADLLSQPS
ncbi:MAG: LysR family transcriptional regulator [Firmicutes bacterium]|nr:LysR family transcriptional regulator [Bacillota bacterium]